MHFYGLANGELVARLIMVMPLLFLSQSPPLLRFELIYAQDKLVLFPRDRTSSVYISIVTSFILPVLN